MKKSDLVPGTKVLASVSYDDFNDSFSNHKIVKYFHDHYDESTLTGVVLDKPASDKCVIVLWHENDEEMEVEVQLLTLDTDRSLIETEFKSTVKQVKDKMKEAAKLVREANALAKKGHAPSLANMSDAIRPLINAMDSAGWRSSSWGC